MNPKEELIHKILDVEWELFHNVPNAGGPAPCQNDRKAFQMQRFAQAMSWSEATLESYLQDLLDAKESQRNLMTEKYANMMKSTWPEEYAKIAPLLPPVHPEVPPLVEEIIRIELRWQESLLAKYPCFVERGRPLYSREDTAQITSFETYLRGELSTYSLRTLKRYHEQVQQQESQGVNGIEISLEYIAQGYGYASAREANSILSQNSPDA